MPPPRSSRDLYAKLGVTPNASFEAIRRAHKVLKDTYCPGGAYIDDAMHQAYMEVAGAAAILTNPKTRKLYDQGEIDDSGNPTPAALAKTSRARKKSLAGALVIACLGGLLILGLRDLNRSSVRPTEGAGNKIAVTPASNPVPLPSAAREPPVSAPPPAEKEPGAGLGDRSQAQNPAPAQANSRDYLPPDTVLRSDRDRPEGGSLGSAHSPIWQRSVAGNARQSERTKHAVLSKPGWKSWPGGAAQADDHGPVSRSLRTAHCLACLTNHQAECANACP